MNALYIALTALWAPLLLSGIFLTSSRWLAATRVASSFVLVVLAWGSWRAAPAGMGRRFARGMAIGMTLGFLGDIALAVPENAGQSTFFLGMGLFAVGHVAYIHAVWRLGEALELRNRARQTVAVGAWLLFGLIAWWLVMFDEASFPNVLGTATLGYTLLLATMAGVTSGLASQNTKFFALALGGKLFLLSDLVLGTSLFTPALFQQLPEWVRHNAVWLLYGPAQALLVYSTRYFLESSGGNRRQVVSP